MQRHHAYACIVGVQAFHDGREILSFSLSFSACCLPVSSVSCRAVCLKRLDELFVPRCIAMQIETRRILRNITYGPRFAYPDGGSSFSSSSSSTCASFFFLIFRGLRRKKSRSASYSIHDHAKDKPDNRDRRRIDGNLGDKPLKKDSCKEEKTAEC